MLTYAKSAQMLLASSAVICLQQLSNVFVIVPAYVSIRQHMSACLQQLSNVTLGLLGRGGGCSANAAPRARAELGVFYFLFFYFFDPARVALVREQRNITCIIYI
jgi:hypothetical protein